MKRGFVLCAALLLAACGDSGVKEGALTSDEEQQLNDAAAMLDEPGHEGSAATGPEVEGASD